MNSEYAPKTLRQGKVYLYVIVQNHFRKKELSFLGTDVTESLSFKKQNTIKDLWEKRRKRINGGYGVMKIVYLGTIDKKEFKDSSAKHINKSVGSIGVYPLNVGAMLSHSHSQYYRNIQKGFSTFVPFSTDEFEEKNGPFSLVAEYEYCNGTSGNVRFVNSRDSLIHQKLLQRVNIKTGKSSLNIKILRSGLQMRLDSSISDVIKEAERLSFWKISHYTEVYAHFYWDSEQAFKIDPTG